MLFFFQAEDGIRDTSVTGVQTCALPIYFAFKIATVNGTGSASANGLLMQSIYRMGIPVSGKNVFPSNIQGLPTWYEIRVNKDGHTARPAHVDLVVALNPATYAKDMAAVRRGGWLLYDSSWPLDQALAREDITILGVPFGRLCVDAFTGDRERTLTRNIAYTGALVALLDIDMDVLGEMIREQFAKKRALLDSNFRALHLGYDYAKKHFPCPLPIRLERMNATREHVLMDGNTAAALGCLYAGATVGAWYPITPATSLMEAFTGLCKRYRVDTKHIALFPADPGECFYMSLAAFDLAERFQTPVFVVSDLDIGMNDWMVKRLTWDDNYRPDRGKVLGAEQLERIQRFSRYLDVDGDGIAARSLPGVHPKGAYFVRGSGHDKHGAYTDDAAEYQEVVERLAKY